MKKVTLIYFMFYLSTFFGQVGVGTLNPTASLDINGNLRIRSISQNNNSTGAKDSILVSNNVGNVMRVTSKQVIESHFKTFIKGSFISPSDVSLTLSSGTRKIPFDFEEFDTHNEFDTATATFTATQNGIYDINVHIKSSSGVSVATDLGVAILKNGTVICRDSFANIGVTVIVTTINVTPPVRSINTLTNLLVGDTITFNINSTLGSLGILGSKEDTYFTIHQVR